MILAKYYKNIDENTVKCFLCPHGCVLKPKQTGICMARRNDRGELYSLNYGKITSLALDPIEKKPLRRFYPGSVILSAGSFGCNLKCSFCQNFTISQRIAEYEDITPEELVHTALDLMGRGNIGIAYTYNEPSIWYEFVYDAAKLAHEKGLKNVLVSNGYIEKQPMENLLPYIDAMNIDLKAISNQFYQNICKGSIEEVKNTIKLCANKCHVEVTTLLIPGYNDSFEEIESIASFLSDISPEIPLHLTKYHPDYHFKEPQTMDRERVKLLADIAKRHLKYVF